ncbi:protein kinase domain-containing protein [Citrus sinensis]|nr:protein kinase domain-containing protein [Citrus sinensis]
MKYLLVIKKLRTLLVLVQFLSSTEISGNQIPTLALIPSIVSNNSLIISDLDVPIAIRKGVRNCTKHPIANYLSYQRLSKNHKAFTSRISHLFVPRNVQEALDDPNWKLAVMEEMNALRRSGTWEIVDLPRDKKIVGCKWVFTIKCNADGSVERYKARLVAKGFTQTYGIDYQETFALVAKINSIRILLSLAVNCDWHLHQLDVKNAFLNGDLKEEVFISLPPGFEKSLGSDKVCRLRKSLYGLKQSPRAWFERFGKAVISYGFLQSQGDHTIFYKHSKDGKITILIVYVDDIILTGDDETELAALKKRLAKKFQIKDLGVLKYFLGMEFARSKEGIFVNQRKYVLDLLGETGLLGCKMVETPIDPNLKLQPAKVEEVKDREQYPKLIGKFIYLSHTRPDIAFAVSMVSQFMHSPGAEHFEAVYRILRYLKGTPGRGLMFKKHGHLQVEVYTDADWAGSVTDRRSTSGYCSFIGGNLVTWRSKKQNVVARSSAGAEFRAIAHGICEVMWIKRILEELKFTFSTPLKVYCDNKAAISIAHNPVLHDRTKHIEVDKHFIKEKLNTGIICMTYLPTTEQLADVLTKGLHKKQFDKLTSKLAMEDIFKPA